SSPPGCPGPRPRRSRPCPGSLEASPPPPARLRALRSYPAPSRTEAPKRTEECKWSERSASEVALSHFSFPVRGRAPASMEFDLSSDWRPFEVSLADNAKTDHWTLGQGRSSRSAEKCEGRGLTTRRSQAEEMPGPAGVNVPETLWVRRGRGDAPD